MSSALPILISIPLQGKWFLKDEVVICFQWGSGEELTGPNFVLPPKAYLATMYTFQSFASYSGHIAHLWVSWRYGKFESQLNRCTLAWLQRKIATNISRNFSLLQKMYTAPQCFALPVSFLPPLLEPSANTVITPHLNPVPSWKKKKRKATLWAFYKAPKGVHTAQLHHVLHCRSHFCIPSWNLVWTPECDVPVPGIPGTGNFSFFWWYRNRYRNKLVPEKILGTGIGKIWYRKKSFGTAIGKIWYRNWFSLAKFRNFEDL